MMFVSVDFSVTLGSVSLSLEMEDAAHHGIDVLGLIRHILSEAHRFRAIAFVH